MSLPGLWLILALVVMLLKAIQPALVIWLGVVMFVALSGFTIYGLTAYCLPDADDPKYFEKDDFWEWAPKMTLLFGIPTAVVAILVGLDLN